MLATGMHAQSRTIDFSVHCVVACIVDNHFDKLPVIGLFHNNSKFIFYNNNNHRVMRATRHVEE